MFETNKISFCSGNVESWNEIFMPLETVIDQQMVRNIIQQ